MAVRALAPIGNFPVYDDDVQLAPKVLAVSEHAILWRHPQRINAHSADFPMTSRRLLPKDGSINRDIPVTNACMHSAFGYYYFMTPLAPLTSPRLSHHATCVLPLPSRHKQDVFQAASFASSTQLFVPVSVGYFNFAIVRVVSASALFDSAVTYEVLQGTAGPPRGIAQDISLVVERSTDPDHYSILVYENWFARTDKKVSRYCVRRDGGGVISSDKGLELEVPWYKHLTGDEASRIREILGRRAYCVESEMFRYKLREGKWEAKSFECRLRSIHKYGYAYWSLQQSTVLFEPVQVFGSVVRAVRNQQDSPVIPSLMLVFESGKQTILQTAKVKERKDDRHPVKANCSVASSREGRVVVRFEGAIYAGFVVGALPTLEEAARAACFDLLAGRQRQNLMSKRAFDFHSFIQFCSANDIDS